MRHIKRTHDLSEWINKKLCCMTDFEKVIDFNNMYRAFRKAKCGKGYKNSSAKFNLSALDGVHGLIDQLKNKTYRVSRYVELFSESWLARVDIISARSKSRPSTLRKYA